MCIVSLAGLFDVHCAQQFSMHVWWWKNFQGSAENLDFWKKKKEISFNQGVALKYIQFIAREFGQIWGWIRSLKSCACKVSVCFMHANKHLASSEDYPRLVEFQ